MAPSVQRLTVAAFDFHLWEKPLVGPAVPNGAMTFLADPSAYRGLRVAGSRHDLAELALLPLTGELAHNHFWRRYAMAAGLAAAGTADAREWLLPLRCRPRTLKFSVESKAPAVKAAAHATILLWPFGWSSSIEFSHSAPLGFDEVQTLMASLRSGGPGPFVAAGKPASLAAIFKTLKSTLQNDVGAPGNLPSDTVEVTRRFFVSAVLPAGTPQRWFTDGAAGPGWSDSERADIHAMLLGRPVQPQELGELESRQEFVSTAMPGASFALTHIRDGSLLILRHWQDGGGKPAKHRCLRSNLRTCWAATMALSNWKKITRLDPGMGAAARQLFDLLPDHYKNPLCSPLVERQRPPKKVA